MRKKFQLGQTSEIKENRKHNIFFPVAFIGKKGGGAYDIHYTPAINFNYIYYLLTSLSTSVPRGAPVWECDTNVTKLFIGYRDRNTIAILNIFL